MKHYTVHARSGAEPDEFTFVKDGFNWFAFFVPVVWLIAKAQWLWLILYLLAMGLAVAATRAGNLPENGLGLTVAALSFLMGLEANDIYRRSLARRGYSFLGLAVGSNLEAAELQFFGATGHRESVSAQAEVAGAAGRGAA